MHRMILVGCACVDHINRNGLDNRRSNLREASKAGNCQNVGIRADNKTGFRGVSFDTESQKYAAAIGHHGKVKRLGRFNTPEEAARVYDAAAVILHGEFANTNEAMGLLPARSI